MEVELNGKRYRRFGSEWYDEAYVKPPEIITRELDRRLPDLPPEKPAQKTRKPVPKVSKGKLGAEFEPLSGDDFQQGTTGTTWRRRTRLGGLLAQTLRDVTGRPFMSYSVYRRAEVYIALPEWFDEEDKLPCAKFDFRLDEEKAQVALYIEKPDHPYNRNWDWIRLPRALTDQELRATLKQSMARQGLAWSLELLENDVPVGKVIVTGEEPLQWQGPEGTETINSDTFLTRLDAFPEHQWIDLRLGRTIPKAEAIAAKSSLASKAAEVYVALMPLYEAVSIVRS